MLKARTLQENRSFSGFLWNKGIWSLCAWRDGRVGRHLPFIVVLGGVESGFRVWTGEGTATVVGGHIVGPRGRYVVRTGARRTNTRMLA